MASYNTTGIDGLMLSLEEVADLPEDILLEMLSAEGEVLRRAQEEKIRELELVDTGQLVASITVDKKLRSNGRYSGSTTRYINVYPKGVRMKKNGSAQTATHKYKKRRKGVTESTHEVTNFEVAFIAEFGAPQHGLEAKEWMRLANEEAADEAAQAAMEVYSHWLDSKGL